MTPQEIWAEILKSGRGMKEEEAMKRYGDSRYWLIAFLGFVFHELDLVPKCVDGTYNWRNSQDKELREMVKKPWPTVSAVRSYFENL